MVEGRGEQAKGTTYLISLHAQAPQPDPTVVAGHSVRHRTAQSHVRAFSWHHLIFMPP